MNLAIAALLSLLGIAAWLWLRRAERRLEELERSFNWHVDDALNVTRPDDEEDL